MSEVFARLRAMLTERGTSERWWQAVELALGGGEESALLHEYLVAHASQDESWRGCRVPCGDWELEHPGHGLCETLTRAIEGLPDAVEIHCPPGTFRMGTSPGDEEADEDWEEPAREVTLTRGFWALSTPVTQDMYQAVMGKNPSEFEGPKHPVDSVSWFDAVRFCNQLSEHAGFTPAYRFHGEEEVEWLQDAGGYRLPTEAEWEYLCRAGSTSVRYGELDKVAWFDENSEDETHPVGLKQPNAWGLFDTLGNVFEWCVDEWDWEAYSKLPQMDPANVPFHVEGRVYRGGGWYYEAEISRASNREGDIAGEPSSAGGFRIVRTLFVEAKS